MYAAWGGQESMREDETKADAIELVCAIGHEVGNHLGAIRLQAHFLDEDLDARALAKASVAIDTQAGRAAPLLGLIRPLLADADAEARLEDGSGGSMGSRGAAASIEWAAFLSQIRQHLADEGTRGVVVAFLDVKPASDAAPLESPSIEGFHNLVLALLSSTIERLEAGDVVEVGVEPRGEETAFALTDGGPEEDLSAEAGLRGRPLVLAIARRLLGTIGGRLETATRGGRTRVELILRNDPIR